MQAMPGFIDDEPRLPLLQLVMLVHVGEAKSGSMLVAPPVPPLPLPLLPPAPPVPLGQLGFG
jgi:hypothetical protein